MSKINSRVSHSRKRLLWHLKDMPDDKCAKEALRRLETSMKYAGGFKEVLEVSQADAHREIESLTPRKRKTRKREREREQEMFADVA